MITLKGCPVSPGFARGCAYVHGAMRIPVPRYRLNAATAEDECRRFEDALRRAAEDLARLQRRVEAEIGQAEAEIFDAHLALLHDRQFLSRIGERIERERVNAEWAVDATVSAYAQSLLKADSEYLCERAADIHDLGQRLLRHLAHHNRAPLANLPSGSILVARELYPADLLEIDRAHLAAILTEFGGDTGHAAILARALGVPAISGIEDATRLITSGVELFVDGGSGEVWVDPPASEAARLAQSCFDYERGLAQALSEEKLATQTRDGLTIRLFANIGRAYEAESVGRHALEGVGLFRTEYLFLDEAEAPSFDHQRAVYALVAEQIGERPLVIRTLDLGGDKFPRFLSLHREDNPMLGLRGLRFSLTTGRPLFETQVRAILAVAARGRDVRILLPMVLGPADFAAALSIIHQVAQREKSRCKPQVGAMIETPAAILTIDDILALADFASLGTNDLTQFVLAADRNALGLTEDHAIRHPAILRAIKMATDAAARAGKPLSVCGEVAADPRLSALLVGLGIHALSMSPAASVRVRQQIRAIDSREAVDLARRMLDRKVAGSPHDLAESG
jgi:phosphotransferase system enzyme I (PtsI)